MKSPLSRREFLKLAGLLPLSYAFPPSISNASFANGNSNGQNVLIVVFDAWSALNISLYGYPRETTPNLERLAEKAIVYHNHFAGGHFTTPGTASLLTGTTPWTHRAFKHNDTVDAASVHKNIFNAFSGYHRLAYTHNPLADTLLRQFLTDIDKHTPWPDLYFEKDPLNFTLFKNDQDTASLGWRRGMKRLEEGHAYTLFLSQIYEYFINRNVADIAPSFPRGIPNYSDLGLNYFTLEQGIDWLSSSIGAAPQPFFGYYHFLPPHDPYNTRLDFIDGFTEENYQLPDKPLHLLDQGVAEDRMLERHRWYDEYILYVDAEFARLYEQLERNGILEKTWVILTTDHGEMFERGILGHVPPVFHQPISHIPLLVFPPRQNECVDIYDKTSAIDLLPTLLQVTKQEIPKWSEGVVMPPFNTSAPQPEREITTLQVEKMDENGRVAEATAMLVRGDYKLMWFFGYEQLEEGTELIELYDLANDPEELRNLYPARKDIADEFLEVLRHKLDELNKSYQQ
ncbi:MAG: sulfatase-like hydrolase/transferase [Chloroflexi bacterium]|nr:sulfatase-like hydrolase/transferase [Chloroflexota bacterium]MBL7162176.1 sulfatase-like hydrolase/transferase [Anaerolineales bacterium]